LNQQEYIKTRYELVVHSNIYRICNLGDGVFEKVSAPSCIVIVSNKNLKNKAKYYDYRKDDRSRLAVLLKNEKDGVIASSIGRDSESYILQVSNNIEILKKCYLWPKLKEIAEDVATGVSSGLDKAYVYNQEEVHKLNLEIDLLKKIIIGGEICRYSLKPTSGKQLIYITSDTIISRYKYIITALAQYKDKLQKRREAANGKIPWYALNWPRRTKLFELPKILIRQTADHIMACYDSTGWYCLKSGIIVQLPMESHLHYYYLLGILNSRLMDYIYNDLVGEQARIFPEVKPVQLFKLPIRTINNTDPDERKKHDMLVSYVDQMLKSQSEYQAQKKQLDEHTCKIILNRINNIDRQIDNLVYELYNLSKKEIGLINHNYSETK